jgi:hypothetical protein
MLGVEIHDVLVGGEHVGGCTAPPPGGPVSVCMNPTPEVFRVRGGGAIEVWQVRADRDAADALLAVDRPDRLTRSGLGWPRRRAGPVRCRPEGQRMTGAVTSNTD